MLTKGWCFWMCLLVMTSWQGEQVIGMVFLCHYIMMIIVECSSTMESYPRTIHIICNLIPANVGLWTVSTWQGGQDQWWLIGQAWLLVEWNINNLHRSGLQSTGTPSQLTYCIGIFKLINTIDFVYMFTGCFGESSQQFDSASHDRLSWGADLSWASPCIITVT